MANGTVTKPKLSNIAPLLNSIVVMFIWLNPLIGLSLILQAPNPTLVIVGSYTLSYIWAGIFFLLSAVLLYGKITNHWDLIKLVLSIGLFTKIIFTYALLVLGTQFGFKNIIGILALWLSITWTQFFAVVHFKLPDDKYGK